jgi:hypothetical protein
VDKRILAIVLALLLTITFVACSKKAKDDNDTSTSLSLEETTDSLQNEKATASPNNDTGKTEIQTTVSEPEGTTAATTEETTNSGGFTVPDITFIKPSLNYTVNPSIFPSLNTVPDITFPLTQGPKLSLPYLTTP